MTTVIHPDHFYDPSLGTIIFKVLRINLVKFDAVIIKSQNVKILLIWDLSI